MKVVLAAAVTADGFIGKNSDDLSIKWTSKEDTKYFLKLSREFKNVVLGSKTFQLFRGKLTQRKFFVYSRSNSVENPHEIDMEVVNEDPKELVQRLESSGVESLMIAGGSSIYTQFLKAGVIDELYLTVEPIIFGSGVKLFNEEIETELDLLETINLSDQTKVLHYKVKK